jgi:hypothetical protein
VPRSGRGADGQTPRSRLPPRVEFSPSTDSGQVRSLPGHRSSSQIHRDLSGSSEMVIDTAKVIGRDLRERVNGRRDTVDHAHSEEYRERAIVPRG